MSFRPCAFWIVAVTVITFFGVTAGYAQTTADADRNELLAKNLGTFKETAADVLAVPSVRYNAILAAGQLVSVESSPGNPPVAYPAALLYLLETYRKPDVPHYLKYGALLGIVRHTFLGVAPEQRDGVIDLLLETVMTEFVPEVATLDHMPLDPAAWEWFRLTALDGLSTLKTVGKNGKVVSELLAVIDRKSHELEELAESQHVLTRENWERSRRLSELASKAAKTLGDLDYTTTTNIDAAIITDALIGLIKAVCGIERKMAENSIEWGGASPNPAILREQIVINVKMCMQSVVWGIRSGFLTSRPTENSFYASLKPDELARKKLDILLAKITELSAFLDEGNPPRRSVPSANVPKEFQFTLSELRDALVNTSESLVEKQWQSESP